MGFHYYEAYPCGLGDQNSANVCPCACRKRTNHGILTVLYHQLTVCFFLHVVRRMSLDSWALGCLGSGNILFQKRMSFFLKEPTASLRGDHELQPQS